MRLRAPDGVTAVTIGTVTIEGSEVDVDDDVLVAELVALGWAEVKARKAAKS